MAPGAFSPAHILIVMTVALIVLGPKELPKLVRAGAKIMRDLRALRARLDEEIHAMLDEDAADPAHAVPMDEVPMADGPAPEAMHEVPEHGVEHEG